MSEHKKDAIDQGFNRLFGEVSRRAQGALLGGAVVATLFSVSLATVSRQNINRQENAAKQEQKANARIDALAKKYDIASLDQEAQDAFWRLTQLQLIDIQAPFYFLDKEQIAALGYVQDDIAVLSAALFVNGEGVDNNVDEWDLARELIPRTTQRAMAEAGFEFTKIKPAPCDETLKGSDPFDYSNNTAADFKITINTTQSGAKFAYVPLGTKQEPFFTGTHYGDIFSIEFPPDPIKRRLPIYRIVGCQALMSSYPLAGEKKFNPYSP